MGREVKRVALDFSWPLNEVWAGYVNPHYRECPACGGSGDTLAMQRLSDLVQLLLLSGADALETRCHPYFTAGCFGGSQGLVCGLDMTELTTALAGRAPSRLGHDADDRWTALRKITDAAGLPKEWGRCTACDGEGIDVTNKEAYESWTSTEPPAGEGYQIWETVSEGSPISPVYGSPEVLARHMSDTRWGADSGTSYETWLRFILNEAWAMSGVMVDGKFKTGVEFVAGPDSPTAQKEVTDKAEHS